MKKISLVLIALVFGMTIYAQQERTLKLDTEKDVIAVTYFHDNGEVSQKGFYTKDGKLQGDWLSYDQDGKKIISAKYDNGKKVGKWFYWNGDKLKEVDYSNNAIASVNEWVQDTKVASND